MDDLLRQIAEIDSEIQKIEYAEKGIVSQKRHLKSEREKICARAANEMIEAGCTSSDVDGVRWSIRNTPAKVVVTDEKIIPPKFFKEKTSKSLDRTLLKSALKQGTTIQGATLDNGSVTLVAKGIA